MHIIFDCDEVILEHSLHMTNWIEKEKGIKKSAPLHTMKFDFSNIYPELTFQQVLDLIIEFSLTEEFSRIPFTPDAEETICNLHKNGHKISILTSAGKEEKVKQSRFKNLSHLPIKTENIHILPLGESKLPYLEKMEKGIFVDDLLKNVKIGNQAGHKSILKRTYHNKEENHEYVINLLGDIFDYI